MDVIARRWTIKGAAKTGAPMVVGGLLSSNEPPPFLKPGELVEVVPAQQLAGAVEALRELVAAVDGNKPFDEESDERLWAALEQARAITGGR